MLTISVTGAGTLFKDLGVIGDFGLLVAASLGAAAVLGLVLLVSHRVQDTMTLLILGLLFGYATSAIVSILLHLSESQQIQLYSLWTFGSFGGVTWQKMIHLAPVVLIVTWVILRRHSRTSFPK